MWNKVVTHQKVLFHGIYLPVKILTGLDIQRAGNIDGIHKHIMRSAISINGFGFPRFQENSKVRTAVLVKVGVVLFTGCKQADRKNQQKNYVKLFLHYEHVKICNKVLLHFATETQRHRVPQ